MKPMEKLDGKTHQDHQLEKEVEDRMEMIDIYDSIPLGENQETT